MVHADLGETALFRIGETIALWFYYYIVAILVTMAHSKYPAYHWTELVWCLPARFLVSRHSENRGLAECCAKMKIATVKIVPTNSTALEPLLRRCLLGTRIFYCIPWNCTHRGFRPFSLNRFPQSLIFHNRILTQATFACWFPFPPSNSHPIQQCLLKSATASRNRCILTKLPAEFQNCAEDWMPR